MKEIFFNASILILNIHSSIHLYVHRNSINNLKIFSFAFSDFSWNGMKHVEALNGKCSVYTT